MLALCWLAADPGPSAPVITRAPDHQEGPVAPGELVIVKSAGAGPKGLLGAQLDSSGRVTTSLAGTRVLFDGIAAPLAYTTDGEMMAGVPYQVAGHQSTQVVVEFDGMRSPPSTLAVTAAAPALFTLDSTGRGQAAILNELGCCNSKQNPAAKGSIAVLYATGEGQTNPPGITGSVPFFNSMASYPRPRLPVEVRVGGKTAELIYAGEAPHAIAGLLQINFRVPQDTPVGDRVPITLSIGGWRSPDGVTMAVRPAVQRVLVVDPDRRELHSLDVRLQAAHYYVSTASDLREAGTQVTGNLYPVDLAVLSLALPEAGRIELSGTIRAYWPQVKVVAIADLVDTETLRSADLMEAQAIVGHPLATGGLLNKIYDLLHLKPAPYVN
jgi:uncharacterized protein (TIGR03437 family)